MARERLVYLFDQKVGVLGQEDGRLCFSYDQTWLKSPEARPLSQSLPLRYAPFDDHATRPFFAGLLPEGDLRVRLAKILQVSRQIRGPLVSALFCVDNGNHLSHQWRQSPKSALWAVYQTRK